MKVAVNKWVLVILTLVGVVAFCGCGAKDDKPPPPPPATFAPVADFAAMPTSGDALLFVQFTETSTGSISSWEWDFNNDGTTDSTLQNPPHTYNNPGTYTVSLTVTGSGGSDTMTRADYITVTLPGAPAADFTTAPTSGEAPLSVQFTDASTGSVTSWEWDFDNDGTTDSLLQNPSHNYAGAGTYTVSLTVTGSGGSDNETKTDHITVTASSTLSANFSAGPTSGAAPLTVQFTDTSTGSYDSWSWDFDGDGTTDSTQQNPSHIYNSAGTYTVTLIIDGPGGNDTATKTDYITVWTVGQATYVDGTSGADTNDGTTPASAVKTIQHAIDLAGDGDTVLVADGIYTGTGNKDLDFGGKNITVRSQSGAENCIIDCENSGRGFNFHSGETTEAVVDGFTIRNGNAINGGGINCVSSSSPTIANCIISGNTENSAAGFYGGAGINCDGSSPTIDNCIIENNTCAGYTRGGGIRCFGHSDPTITNCIIRNNSAFSASGISCYSYCSPTITNCIITGNTSGSSNGAGICCQSLSNPTITNCLITNNTCGLSGAGVYCTNSSATLINCTIANNTATYYGGGFYCC